MEAPFHAEIASLRAEVAGLRAENRAQRDRLARLERGARGRHRARLAAALLLAAALALVPTLALADFAFLDLNSGSPHNDNIAAIKAAGITKGCNPPAYDNYCPNANVTREEMASFLARTAGLGGNPPVANALTAQSATNAANSDKLGGRSVTDLARVALGQATIAGNFTNQPNIPTGNTGLDIATATIVAPGPGFVVVIASGAAFTDTASGCPCTVYSRLFDRSVTAPAPASQGVDGTLPNHPTGLFGNAALSNAHVFPVAAAGTRTYAFNVGRIDGGTAHIGAEGTVTALFVPFGYDGGATLGP